MSLLRFYIFIVFLSPFTVLPSFKSATVGIDGLTCSMCSNTVEKQLRQLRFVSDIKMDLNENVAYIQFHPNAPVDINLIAKKVKEAGYSVRFLKTIFNFEKLKISDRSSFSFDGTNYLFLNVQDTELNGDTEIIFLGKEYLPKKEYTNWKVVIESDKKNRKDQKTYYITL